MRNRGIPLDNIQVASPCPANWNLMVGDERKRFCGQCELNVYNLSGMTRREAEALITNSEGRLCVRFFRRADGTVLTRDCPVGLAAFKRRVSRIRRAAMSSVLGFLSGLGLSQAFSSNGKGPFIGQPLMGAVVSHEIPMPTTTSPLEVQGEIAPDEVMAPAVDITPRGGKTYVGRIQKVRR